MPLSAALDAQGRVKHDLATSVEAAVAAQLWQDPGGLESLEQMYALPGPQRIG